MKYEFLYNTSLGLLLIRLGLAAVFIVSGAMKFMNIPGITKFFARLGVPSVLVYVVALVELLGGIAMLLGFGTKVMGWLLAIDMFFAIYLVRFAAGFAGTGYGFEMMLLLASLGISFAGPGGYSISKGQRNIYN
jgi:uncharacterized membrane protein YphA (DoxX/SURF4 family)